MSTRRRLERLRELNERIRNCRICDLWKTRTQSIVGEGNSNSKLMLVAQAPGYREDEEGRMFIGPSGGKLNELLEHAGIERREIYMTNLIKCVLPHYRRPKHREIEACSQYLDDEIEIVKPRIIATLGYFSAKYILSKYRLASGLKFTEVCGETFFANGKRILPLMHPAVLLYNPEMEEEVKEKYSNLKVFLESLG